MDIAPNSINEVGCIHTCQGLEVDYIGVIIGPDLIVRDGRIVTVPEARDRFDKTLRGYKYRFKANPQIAAAEADLIIKNTYRTLMTRDMKGCYVYCSDEETTSYFRNRLSPGVLAAVQPRRSAAGGNARRLMASGLLLIHRVELLQKLLDKSGNVVRQIGGKPHDVVPVPLPNSFEPFTPVPMAATQQRLQLGQLVLKNA